MTTFFGLLSRLPLWFLHGMGVILGWLVFLISPGYRAQFLGNSRQAGLSVGQQLRAIGESGKQVAELPRLWLGKPVKIYWSGTHHLEEGLKAQRGIVCLTPHLGAYEVTPIAYAGRCAHTGPPITVLFRPPRKPWLQKLLATSRERPGMRTAPTTSAGVKQLIKALRRGETVGILPDQVPPGGQGVWVPFFGRPAYTMTLSARLIQQTDAFVLIVWAQRLSWGRGYQLHIATLESALAPGLEDAVLQLNQAMESVIRQDPAQYLWSYARYKAPRDDE